jgi:hypothetical protein
MTINEVRSLLLQERSWLKLDVAKDQTTLDRVLVRRAVALGRAVGILQTPCKCLDCLGGFGVVLQESLCLSTDRAGLQIRARRFDSGRRLHEPGVEGPGCRRKALAGRAEATGKASQAIGSSALVDGMTPPSGSLVVEICVVATGFNPGAGARNSEVRGLCRGSRRG